MADKSFQIYYKKRVFDIFQNYVAEERESIERFCTQTTVAYDNFVKAATIVNPNITTDELDELYYKHYGVRKYRNTNTHWWEDDKQANSVRELMFNILVTMPDEFTSKSDILKMAGAKTFRTYCGTYWEINARHAFNLLEKAGEFERYTIMTCGKPYIHLYRRRTN